MPRAKFDNIYCFTGLLNLSGILLETNETSLRFFGVQSDQISGKPFWECWSYNPDSQNKIKKAIEKGARREFSRFEVEYSNAIGPSRQVDFSLTPVNGKNKDVGSLIVECRDIQETHGTLVEHHSLKEQYVNHAIRIAGMGIWDWDMISDQVVWDKKQFELFGVPQVEGPIPLSTVIDAIHPDDREGLNKVAKKVLAGGGTAFEEFRVVHPDGSIHWLLGGSSVVRFNNSKSSARLIGINMEITKRKEIESALLESQSQLNASNKTLENRIAKRSAELETAAEDHRKTLSLLSTLRRHESIGQLAGGVAHDFNNLLAVISGNLELAALQVTQNETRVVIDDALKAVEEGAVLTKRLLTYARKRKFSPVKLSVDDTVLESVRLLERTLGEGISITTTLDSDLWDLYVDPGEIQGALINMAVNARDAMPKGGDLTIKIRNEVIGVKGTDINVDAVPGEYVGIFVTDTGSGMTIDVMQKALEPFFTTKGPGRGTGLGLSTVYGFAQESGGFVNLESEVGKGTTVKMYLPRAHPQTISDSALVKTLEETHANGERILVVEDNRQVRKVTIKRLEQLGYRAIEASTAEEAIEILKAGTLVDLVFTDIVMPGGMSGYDLSEWITSHKKDVRVLLTSGFIDPETHHGISPEALNTVVLSKPYSLDLLFQRVSEAMKSRD